MVLQPVELGPADPPMRVHALRRLNSLRRPDHRLERPHVHVLPGVPACLCQFCEGLP